MEENVINLLDRERNKNRSRLLAEGHITREEYDMERSALKGHILSGKPEQISHISTPSTIRPISRSHGSIISYKGHDFDSHSPEGQVLFGAWWKSLNKRKSRGKRLLREMDLKDNMEFMKFHNGGKLPGRTEFPILVQGGELIIPRDLAKKIPHPSISVDIPDDVETEIVKLNATPSSYNKMHNGGKGWLKPKKEIKPTVTLSELSKSHYNKPYGSLTQQQRNNLMKKWAEQFHNGGRVPVKHEAAFRKKLWELSSDSKSYLNALDYYNLKRNRQKTLKDYHNGGKVYKPIKGNGWYRDILEHSNAARKGWNKRR